MAISIVNGFFCTSPCDVAKAKKGQDPHPTLNAAGSDATGRDKQTDGGGSQLDTQSVVFGGALAGIVSANRVAPSSVVQASSALASGTGPHIVDLLV